MKVDPSPVSYGSVRAVYFLPVFIFLIYLIPTFPKYTKGELYFGTLLIVAILFLFVVFSLSAVKKVNVKYAATGLLLALVFMALTFLSLLIDLDRIIFSDFIEFIKPIMAFLVFISCFSLIKKRTDFTRCVVKPYSVLFILIAFMGILEVYFGLDKITHVLYTKPRAILQGKAVSPFGVTYFYASFMLFASIFFIARTLVSSKINIVYFLICGFALILSQSRTLFISYVGGIVFFNTLYLFYRKFPSRLRIFLLVFSIVTFLMLIIFYYWDFINVRFLYLYTGLSSLLKVGINLEGGGSANVRIGQIVWAFNNNLFYGIVGTGIGKGYSVPLESFYATYLYRYGFVGIFVYVSIAVFFLIMTFKAAKVAYKNREYDAFAYFLAAHVFILLLPVTSLSSNITDQFIFMFLYYGSLGFTLKYLRLKSFCAYQIAKVY